MIEIQIFLLLTTLIIFFMKSLDFIYLLQTKEYRFDRFFSLIKDEGVVTVFLGRLPRLPAKTPRNYLLVTITLLFSLTLLFFLSFLSLFEIFFVFILSPFAAFINIVFGIIITYIPVFFYRQRFIKKATNLVKNSKTIFIGITGSYGKTTTKEFLFQILSKKYKVTRTEANINTAIGVAQSVIRNLKKDTQIFIVEIGAYRRGEIKQVCDMVKPKYGILTAIGNQHFDLFGSKNNLILAKKELLEALPKEGTAYINRDIEDYEKITTGLHCKICSFSVKKQANIFVDNSKKKEGTTEFNVSYRKASILMKTKLYTPDYFYNLLPCIALGIDLKIEENRIVNIVGKLTPLDDKLSLQKGINGIQILNDSYNSSRDGFLLAITLADQSSKPKKIIVSRGIIELGSQKLSTYREIVNRLNETNIILCTTDRDFKNFDTKRNVLLFADDKQLLNYIVKNTDKNSLIAIEGKFTPEFIKKLIV